MSMIQNFTKSIVNHAMNSFQYVSNDKQIERMNICQKCEHFDHGRCSQCGCFLAIKTGWASEKCPIDKWGSEIRDLQPPPPPVQSDCGCNKKNV